MSDETQEPCEETPPHFVLEVQDAVSYVGTDIVVPED